MPAEIEDKVPGAVARALTRIGVVPDDLILVALSGGPDSVAMLHAMLALRERFGYRLAAAHLNHAIRGAESDRDEALAREMCVRIGVELHVERADGLSAEMPNLEEEAREARHGFLGRISDRTGARYIALAHHSDDQAETVMLRLLRGAGTAGLGGIAERGPGRLIRPVLSLTRADLRAYIDSVGAPFAIDASNESLAILRNRVRRHLLPLLEREYAPGIGRRLAEFASEMRRLDTFVTAEARRAMVLSGGDALDLSSFAKLDPALKPVVLREFLKDQIGSLRRIGRTHIDAILGLCFEGPPNGALDIPGKVRVVREYGLLRVAHRPDRASGYSIALAGEGVTELAQAGMVLEAAIVPVPGLERPADKFEALLDAREAGPRLLVRSSRAGDRVAPLGMSGHRKLKEIFIDAKVPKSKRDSFPVVEVEGGGIVWVPGLVRTRIALVTEASTGVLRLRSRPLGAKQAPLRAI